ncbi:hypothetical protein CYMTET_6375 [Cymbomonas tetramitiformis]|uniref:Uncharacterized protein n=1 Tax=Cymbomonas tetramitiformis TaxID=36881 RepID=A0AAE0GXI9_9CHLO|nr:hypothetical protein CYMTET_6375 [Cymbomonas tetramitiformis]
MACAPVSRGLDIARHVASLRPALQGGELDSTFPLNIDGNGIVSAEDLVQVIERVAAHGMRLGQQTHLVEDLSMAAGGCLRALEANCGALALLFEDDSFRPGVLRQEELLLLMRDVARCFLELDLRLKKCELKAARLQTSALAGGTGREHHVDFAELKRALQQTKTCLVHWQSMRQVQSPPYLVGRANSSNDSSPASAEAAFPCRDSFRQAHEGHRRSFSPPAGDFAAGGVRGVHTGTGTRAHSPSKREQGNRRGRVDPSRAIGHRHVAFSAAQCKSSESSSDSSPEHTASSASRRKECQHREGSAPSSLLEEGVPVKPLRQGPFAEHPRWPGSSTTTPNKTPELSRRHVSSNTARQKSPELPRRPVSSNTARQKSPEAPRRHSHQTMQPGRNATRAPQAPVSNSTARPKSRPGSMSHVGSAAGKSSELPAPVLKAFDRRNHELQRARPSNEYYNQTKSTQLS